MSRPSRAIALAVALSVSGCAFSLEGPRPDRPRDKRPECDTGKGLVGFDVIMATLSGITAIAMLKADSGEVALLPIAIGALYAGGAVSGSHSVDECRVAIAEYDLESDRAHLADVREPQQPLPADPAVVPAPAAPRASPAAIVDIEQPAPPTMRMRPPSGAPTPAPAAAPAAAPAPPADDDDWSAFWKEVP